MPGERAQHPPSGRSRIALVAAMHQQPSRRVSVLFQRRKYCEDEPGYVVMPVTEKAMRDWSVRTKPIADARFGDEVSRLGRVVAELLTQRGDQDP